MALCSILRALSIIIVTFNSSIIKISRNRFQKSKECNFQDTIHKLSNCVFVKINPCLDHPPHSPDLTPTLSLSFWDEKKQRSNLTIF